MEEIRAVLKLRSLKYEICKYGPAIAHPVIVVELGPTEKSIDLFTTFRAVIKDKGLEAPYERAINGKLETYFVFKGDIFENENILVYEDLMNKISIESAETQKDLIAQKKMTTDKLRPPFFMWEGVPTHFTKVAHSDKQDFRLSAYDDFNIPYAIISKDCGYSPIALQQMMNNTFGTTFVLWEDESSKELVEETRKVCNGFKCFILAPKSKYKEAEKYALENGYTIYMKY